MDMTAAMELRIKNDQAKAALAATKADLKGVGEAAKEASVDGAKLVPGLSAGGNQASAAVAALKAKLMSVTASVQRRDTTCAQRSELQRYKRESSRADRP